MTKYKMMYSFSQSVILQIDVQGVHDAVFRDSGSADVESAESRIKKTKRQSRFGVGRQKSELIWSPINFL